MECTLGIFILLQCCLLKCYRSFMLFSCVFPAFGTYQEVFSGRMKIPSNKWGLLTLKEQIRLAALIMGPPLAGPCRLSEALRDGGAALALARAPVWPLTFC